MTDFSDKKHFTGLKREHFQQPLQHTLKQFLMPNGKQMFYTMQSMMQHSPQALPEKKSLLQCTAHSLVQTGVQDLAGSLKHSDAKKC